MKINLFRVLNLIKEVGFLINQNINRKAFMIIIVLFLFNMALASTEKCFKAFKHEIFFKENTDLFLPKLNSSLGLKIEQDLKNLEFASASKPINQGISGSEFIYLKNNITAIWKPYKRDTFSNYKAEILAYELDQILGLNIVPPTVERTINSKRGSVQIFMQSSDNSFLPMSEIDKQSFFDFIIDNGDRHSNNFLASISGDEIISIDHGMSFTGVGDYRKSFFRRRDGIKRFFKTEEAQYIMNNMKNLNLKDLEKKFLFYLSEKDSKRLIRRMEFSIQYFDEIMGR